MYTTTESSTTYHPRERKPTEWEDPHIQNCKTSKKKKKTIPR